MGAEVTGIANVRTKTKGDVAAKLVDTGGTNELVITGPGHILIDLFAGDGTSLGHVSDALKIDITSQALNGVKTSRDGAAPTAANGIYAEVTTANAVLGAANPLPAQLSQGGAVLTATNGLFTNILQGNAVLSATHGLFTNILNGDAVLSATNVLSVRLSDGAAYNAQANPVFAAVSKNNAINAVANAIWVVPSDGTTAFGTPTNPISVTIADPSNPVGSPQNEAALSALLAANGGVTDIVIYTPPNAEVFTLLEVTVSSSDYAHFQVFLGATLVDTIFTGQGYTTHTKSYKTQARSFTGNATLTFRVEGTNDSHQQQKLAASYEATKV